MNLNKYCHRKERAQKAGKPLKLWFARFLVDAQIAVSA